MLSQSVKMVGLSEKMKTPAPRIEAQNSSSGEATLTKKMSEEHDLLPLTRRIHGGDVQGTTTTDEFFTENDFTMPDELDYNRFDVIPQHHRPQHEELDGMRNLPTTMHHR